MKALFYIGTEASEVRDADAPVAGEGETLVDLVFCGICGSDMHAWHGKDARRVPPLILGHEAVGTAKNGPFTGKPVAINPLISCASCHYCNTGAPQLCTMRELIGMRLPGAFAEQIVVPDRNLSVIDNNLSFANAALAEPLAVAVRTVRVAIAHTADRDAGIVIIGGGAIGLLCALVLRVYGHSHIRIAEPNALRRDLLDALDSGEVFDPVAAPAQDASADIVIDAVGSGITRAAGSAIVRPGGIMVHVGLQDSDPGLDTRRFTLQDITFTGTYCYRPDDFSEALRLLTAGAVNGDGWTEIRDLQAGAQAFVDIHQGKAPPKIILATGSG